MLMQAVQNLESRFLFYFILKKTSTDYSKKIMANDLEYTRERSLNTSNNLFDKNDNNFQYASELVFGI